MQEVVNNNIIYFFRGEIRSLWVGCIIALLAGAAVALGILSDNVASLVGVAISTSLMPPAVNAVGTLGIIISLPLKNTQFLFLINITVTCFKCS